MKQITQRDYQALLGLRVLADRHVAALNEIHAAVMEITGEEDTIGHSNDSTYGSRELDEMLKLLEIKVV